MTGTIKKLINKYQSMPIQAKASIWFVICSVLQRGISVLTVPIFTRMMSPEQYGMYGTYVSWYTILLVFTSLNLFYGVFNNAMVKFEADRERYISSMQGLTASITTAFFIVYLIFQDKVNALLEMSTPLVLLLFLELLVTPALQFWMVRNRFDYKYRIIVAVTLLKSILNPALGIAFVLLSEENEKGFARIASIVLVEALVCGAIAVYQFVKGKCFFHKKYWKYAVLFNLSLMPHYLAGAVLNQGDRILIRKLDGLEAVAFYGAAYNIGILVNKFTSAVTSTFTPWMYQELKEKRTKGIARNANLLLIGMLIFVMLLMFVGPEALLVFADSEYQEAAYVIPPIAGSVFFIFMHDLFSHVELFFEERKYVTIMSVVAAVSNIVLNVIFIPVFGYYAAAYVSFVCYIVYGLSHLFFAKRVAKRHLDIDEVFYEKATLGLSAAIVIAVIAQNFLYPYFVLRYCILAAMLVIVVIKRKPLLEGLRMLKKS